MATKTKWVCQSCGYETPKYMGKCPECGSWASFVEDVVSSSNEKSKQTKIVDLG